MSDAVFEEKKGSGLKYLGIGCLAVVLIVVVAGVVGGIIVANNWRGWIAAPTRQAITELIDDSSLPEDQKAGILAEADAFIAAFEAGDVTVEELGRVAEELAQSPIAAMIGAYVIDEQYIGSSGLPEEEKEAGRYQLRRAARGVYEELIDPNDLNNLLDPLEPDPGESQETRIDAGNFVIVLASPSDVDDEEVRELIANARQLSDDSSVPDEEFEIDYAEEVRSAIEKALGRELPRAGP